MTVVALPTRSSSQWATADAALRHALPVADHPRLTEHAAIARRVLAEAGQPTPVWANRIAAIAVIANRRADTAPTIARRAAYCDVAAAAAGLLLLAEVLHDVRPDPGASQVLAGLRLLDREDSAALL